jgi:hypothetical protein
MNIATRREDRVFEQSVYTDTMRRIWQDHDPYANFPDSLYGQDTQGWGSGHPWLADAVKAVRPKVVVEIGVWKGGSVMTLAKAIKEQDLDACVIAIDTWLGAWDHWLDARWFKELCFENGQPRIMKKFLQNIVSANLQNYVVPLPLDSVNANVVLQKRGIRPDIIHIDGGHDYRAVITDLMLWWPLLRPGGILIGDDYTTEGGWPGVRQAFDEFFTAQGVCPIPLENHNYKCRVVKPETGS